MEEMKYQSQHSEETGQNQIGEPESADNVSVKEYKRSSPSSQEMEIEMTGKCLSGPSANTQLRHEEIYKGECTEKNDKMKILEKVDSSENRGKGSDTNEKLENEEIDRLDKTLKLNETRSTIVDEIEVQLVEIRNPPFEPVDMFDLVKTKLFKSKSENAGFSED